MNLLGYSWLQVAEVFGAVGAAITVLYILKLRRRRFEVPFSKLWQRVLEDKDSTSLFRRLKRLLSLLLQLTVLALLALALGEPFFGDRDHEGRHIVLVMDTSASMRAIDQNKLTRFENAKVEVRKVLAGLGADDAVLVLRTDGQTAAPSFNSDAQLVRKVVDDMAPTDVPADMSRALHAASDALRGRKNPELVIVGDGAYPQDVLDAVDWGKPPVPGVAKRLDAIDLKGIPAHFVSVGDRKDNIGIVEFNVRRYLANKLSYEIFIEIQNFTDEKRTVELELLAGGETVSTETIELPKHERVRKIFPNKSGLGSLLEARLSVPGKPKEQLDALELDNHAFALLPSRKKETVLVVSEGNMFLEGALMLDENLDVVRIPPKTWDDLDEAGLAKYAAVVFDGFTPKKLPERGNFLLLDPAGDDSPFKIAGVITRPFLTDLAKDNPVLRWVTLADVNIGKASYFTLAPGDISLASNIRQPVIVARRERHRKIIAVGFDVRESDLPMRVAWPVMLINSLDWFANDDSELLTTFHTGHLWHIPFETSADQATVIEPGGEKIRAAVADGRVQVLGRRVGFHTVSGPDADPVQIAANLADPIESQITPHADLVLSGVKLDKPVAHPLELPKAIWTYLLLAGAALLLLEWLSYNRRWTV